jgi:flagellar M-ring protein FliF
MQRLSQLAQAAVGYDAQRGDSVVVENVSFTTNVPEAPANQMDKVMDQARGLVNENPGALHGLLVALGILLLLFAVLRPAARKITAVLTQPAQLPARVHNEEVDSNLPPMTEGVRKSMVALPARRPRQAQAVFDHVVSQIKHEPSQTVRLLETWINSSDSAD